MKGKPTCPDLLGDISNNPTPFPELAGGVIFQRSKFKTESCL